MMPGAGNMPCIAGGRVLALHGAMLGEWQQVSASLSQALPASFQRSTPFWARVEGPRFDSLLAAGHSWARAQPRSA